MDLNSTGTDPNSTPLVNESELQSFCDETGYLSPLALNRFLVTKRICRLGKYNELILLLDKDGKTSYFDWTKKIKAVMNRKHYKDKGNMGVIIQKDESKNETDKIAEEIVSKW